MRQPHRNHPLRKTILKGIGLVAAVTIASLLYFRSVGFASAVGNLNIIPRPASVERGEGVFVLTDHTPILPGSPRLKPMGVLFREAIRKQTGLSLEVKDASPATSSGGGITLGMNTQPTGLGAEGYELVVSKKGVTIRADKPAGVFYGIQSLLQMLSPALSANRGTFPTNRIYLPVLRILDQPRFSWRGLLLDCSRTFLPLDFLKKYVDVLSFYKMNVLQLHLTDDQGWRLQIRKYPRLTEVGSKFDPRFAGEVNGFYTQEQIKELVRYASERHVTIVPEIDMPAHCLSLLKAYPELSCRGGKDHYLIVPYLFQTDHDPNKEPKTPYGVLCPGNEKTFQVIEDILTEVMELFPSQYIHIGGDECPRNFWQSCPKCQARMKAEGLKNEEELQSYFSKRVAKIIRARGRTPVGWGEILEGGLPPGVAVMSWQSMDAGIAAAKLGHPVVMASKSHVFFDYGYNRSPASLVYTYNPVPPELDTPALRSLVLGGEACMWTHLARTVTGIDMSVFPRLLALAEALWTPSERHQWVDFDRRMKLHESVLKAKGVTCFVRNPGLGLPNITCGQDGRVWLVNAAGKIFLREGDQWEKYPGKAHQVTSGPDGTIWSVSDIPKKRGYELMHWSESENAWRPIGKAMSAVQISAAPDGSLWAATDAYAIFRIAEGKWANVIGLAREVSVGSDNMVWALTMDPGPGGFEIHSKPPAGRFHRVLPVGAAVELAAAGPGEAWLSLDNGDVQLLHNGKFHHKPGRLIALTSAMNGEAWAIAKSPDNAQLKVVQWTDGGWKEISPMP